MVLFSISNLSFESLGHEIFVYTIKLATYSCYSLLLIYWISSVLFPPIVITAKRSSIVDFKH